jgi:DNA-directed RNA polymerase specialized sigma24 family protein
LRVEAEQFTSTLVTEAEAVLQSIIRFKLRACPHEAEDLFQEARLQLWQRMQAVQDVPQTVPKDAWRSIAATIAWRVCAQRLRQSHPQFQALRNRVLYALTRQAGFAQWRAGEQTIAGFAEWQDQRAPLSQGRLRILLKDRAFAWQRQRLAGAQGASLIELLAAIFNQAAAPVPLNELVAWLAEFLQLAEPKAETLDALTERELASAEADPSWLTEQRVFLQRLWEELRELPLHQRAALLLNLRDEAGRGCIALFVITGVATLAQLAAALKMTDETFAALWNDLPLEDLRVAELLGLTRQQVINARKSARERLVRRLRGFA